MNTTQKCSMSSDIYFKKFVNSIQQCSMSSGSTDSQDYLHYLNCRRYSGYHKIAVHSSQIKKMFKIMILVVSDKNSRETFVECRNKCIVRPFTLINYISLANYGYKYRKERSQRHLLSLNYLWSPNNLLSWDS